MTKEKLIQLWSDELELDYCQQVWFCPMAEQMSEEDLAKFFIVRDLSKGMSLNQVVTKYSISKRKIRRIRDCAGIKSVS